MNESRDCIFIVVRIPSSANDQASFTVVGLRFLFLALQHRHPRGGNSTSSSGRQNS
ncbi:protein of unknown function [Paraburkholderia dioscoreae]|uniref:Uncharacterized protein n=1 Tax=Paraburkholderia dioscoreae TaxID=2604047 RepID=A0A5Q4YWJ6_9BURK|nr:protein of unknown function [Paraburkholderia dioscoreae]